MAKSARFVFLLVLLTTLAVPLRAQQPVPVSPADRAEVVSALKTVATIMHDVTADEAGARLGKQLRKISRRLREATAPFGLTASADTRPGWSPNDRRRLERALVDLYEQLRDVQEDLMDDEEYALSNRLDPIADGLRDVALALRTDDDGRAIARAERRRDHLARESFDDRDHDTRAWWRRRHDWQRSYAFVGELWNRWPYPTNGVYRPVPAMRYNRVEGLVLGIGSGPLAWDSYHRGKIIGQAAYALDLERWRYSIGAETRLGKRYGDDGFDIKLGGDYHRQTTTNDLWKASWAENSLAAIFANNDYFDYFETQGWTFYGVAHITPYVQVSAGFRHDTYRTLKQKTTWSLFGGGGFRPNPAVMNGDMNSLVFALEGGRVRHLDRRPSGAAFRLEAEFGKGLGGDFSFDRYLGDARVYVQAGSVSGLSLRLRGGLTTGQALPQKMFTLGGVGSMRAYPQNSFYATRMLLANTEVTFYDGSPLGDILGSGVQIFGLFDAGWVNSATTDRFRFDDVLPSAGFGASIDHRHIRLELAWPLRDVGTGTRPTVWLRLNPTF